MPIGLVKDLAKRYGLEVSTVEGFWNRCKSSIDPEHGKAGYGVVVNCVKAKCREAKKK